MFDAFVKLFMVAAIIVILSAVWKQGAKTLTDVTSPGGPRWPVKSSQNSR